MFSIIKYWEMQIKTIIRYHQTPIRMTKIKRIVTKPNVDEDAEKLDPLYFAGKNVKWYITMENSLAVSYETKYVTIM